MVGTSLTTMGGISGVVRTYKEAGLFARWPIVYVSSHGDGSSAIKALWAIGSYLRFVALLFSGTALLHIHSASNASFWRKSIFVILARLTACPVVFHIHGGGFVRFYESRCGRMRRRIVRRILESSAVVVVTSKYWKTSLARLVPCARIVVIPNPVKAHPEQALVQSRRAENVVLFLGRITEQKGIYDLVRAFARIARRFPGLSLKIAGAGDIAKVQELARSLSVADSVEFAGWVSGRNKVALLQEATVLVLPSYVEGFPVSVLEGMEAGAPVIASNVGAIPEMIRDGVHGLLIAPGDIDALERSLDQILRSGQLRQQLSNRAKEKVAAEFAVDKVMPKLEGLYAEFCVPRII